MEYVLTDFTDRAEMLDLMQRMAAQEVEPRVLVIESQEGMGKSYLLKEFQAQCKVRCVDVVSIDFAQRYQEPGYMYVIEQISKQVEQDVFEPLWRVIDHAVNRSRTDQGLNEARSARPAPLPDAKDTPPGQDVDAPGAIQTSDQSGGINISGGEVRFEGTVAGRDLYNIIQVIAREDPYVHRWVINQITGALRECLQVIDQARPLVFLIDHWDRADESTIQWLLESLVKWAMEKFSRLVVIAAGQRELKLEKVRRVQREKLAPLGDKDVYTYWVVIYRLPEEALEQIRPFIKGVPKALHMIAELQVGGPNGGAART